MFKRTIVFFVVSAAMLFAVGCGTDWTYDSASVTEVSLIGESDLTANFEVTGMWGDTQGKFVRFDIEKFGNKYVVDMIGKTPESGLHRPSVVFLKSELFVAVDNPGIYTFEFSTWNGEPITQEVEFN